MADGDSDTYFGRVSAAYGEGTNVGTAFDVADASHTKAEARAAGKAFGFVDTETANLKARPAPPKAEGGLSSLFAGAMHAASKYIWTPVTDYVEASYRYSTNQIGQDTSAGLGGKAYNAVQSLGGAVGLGFLDPEFRQDWSNVVDDQSSIAQTVWETQRAMNAAGQASRGTNVGRYNPVTREYDLPLIDDIDKRGERAEYFGNGYARWVTGTVDAGLAVLLDPTVVLAAGAGAAAKSARTLKAMDVEKTAQAVSAARDAKGAIGGAVNEGSAASAADVMASQAVSGLTAKQSRFAAATAALVDHAWTLRNTHGATDALARSSLLSQTPDAGALAYLLRTTARDTADEATAKALMSDVVFAGAGDREALSRLALRSEVTKTKQLELENMLSPNSQSNITDMLMTSNLSHEQRLGYVLEDPAVMKQINAQADVLEREWDAIERVQRVGAPLGVDSLGDVTHATQAGAIRNVGITGKDAARDSRMFAKVVKTVETGQPGLRAMHLIAGRKFRGVFSLSADDAAIDFNAMVDQGMKTLKGNQEAIARLAQLKDMFASARGALDVGVSRSERYDVARQYDKLMTKYLVEKHAADGVGRKELRQLIDATRGMKASETQVVHGSMKRAFDKGDRGVWVDENGIYQFDKASTRALGGSQYQDLYAGLDYADLDRAIRKQSRGGRFGHLLRTVDGGVQLAETALEGFNSVWKFATLLRPVGYMVRNQVDTQARLIAHNGPLFWFAHAAQGIPNTVINNTRRVSRSEALAASRAMATAKQIDEIDRAIEQGVSEAAEKSLARRRADLKSYLARPWEERIAETHEALGKNPAVDGVRLSHAGDEKVALGQTEFGKRTGKTARVDRKTGEVTLPKDSDAYRSMEDFHRTHDLTAARSSILGIMDSERSNALRQIRSTGQYVPYVPGEFPNGVSRAAWNDAYLEAVNKHLINIPIARRMAAGADDGELLAWFQTADGRAFWRTLATDRKGASKWSDPSEYLSNLRQHMDLLLPNEAIRRRALAGDLSHADVEEVFPKVKDRPIVPGKLNEEVSGLGNQLWDAAKRSRATYFKWASEMPETMMGRSLFYQKALEQDMKRLMSASGKDDFSVAELAELRKHADINARREVGRYMFDTSRQSNLSHHLRFISPFYSAWEDTMVKWSRIAGENWATAPLMWQGLNAPGKMLVVTDDDGYRIMPNGDVVAQDPDTGELVGEPIRKTVDPTEGSIHFTLPFGLFDTGGTEGFKVRRGAMNILLQGEPFWLPGGGPLVSVGVNEVRRNITPEIKFETPAGTVDIGKWVQPFGVTDESYVDQLLPMWLKNAIVAKDGWLGDGLSSDRFASTVAQFAQEHAAKIAAGDAEKLSKDELMALAYKRARNYWTMRAIGSQMPFSTSPDTEMAVYVEKYHQYTATYGAEAGDEKFRQDFPEYYDLTYSLTADNTGVRANEESWDEAKKYRSLIATAPEYGRIYSGAGALLPGWSQAVYETEKYQSIDKTTSTKFRETRDPDAVYEDTQVNEGWRRYNEFVKKLNVALIEAGGVDEDGDPVLSLRSNAAEPFREAKAQFIEQLSTENQEWARKFNEGYTADNAVNLLNHFAGTLKESKSLASRPDMQVLSEYMRLRAKMREVMAQAGVTSIDSQAARDAGLADTWGQITERLVAQSPVFEQNIWIGGRLDADDLTKEVTAGG